MQEGGTLIVNVGKLQKAALLGSGSATLTIDSAAKLELVGDKAGNEYPIAASFAKVESVWADENVSGSEKKKDDTVLYTVLSDDSSVSVKVEKPEQDDETDDNDIHQERHDNEHDVYVAVGDGLTKLVHRIGNAGHDTGENQHRDTVADPPFSHQLTQPH